MKVLFILFLTFNLFKMNHNHTRIKSGRVELIKEDGSLVRTIYSNNTPAVDADMSVDGRLVVITLENGSVDLRKENGSDVRTLFMYGANKAKRARFEGENVIITFASGKSQLTKQNGSVIKIF